MQLCAVTPARMSFPTAMISSDPIKLRAATVGPEIGNRLSGGARCNGFVAAVFPTVVYISLETGMLCITRKGMDSGPFTVEASATRRMDFKTEGLCVDQAVHADSRRILVPGRLEMEISAAWKWMPDKWPDSPDSVLIARGLDRLRLCLPANIRRIGLGGFVIDGHCPENGDLVGREAKESVYAARRHVANSSSVGRSSYCWARKLIGLGPGLTPSGDDFIGGLLIAMHAIGKPGQAGRLWSAISEDARASTNPISLALLAAAAKGLGNASLHSTICAILAGANPRPHVERLSSLGHSSGWDALAGAVAALNSFSKRPLEAAA